MRTGSLVYPEFERIIRVSRDDGSGNYALASDLGEGGDISMLVEEASFSLSKDRGCAQGELVLGAWRGDGSLAKHSNPWLLSPGDLVEFVPEPGAQPWYSGIVVAPRERGSDLRHGYILDGLASKLTGKAPVETATPLIIGTAAPEGSLTDLFYVSDTLHGIVQALAQAGGPITSGTGIIRPANFDYANMVYSMATQIKLMEVDWTMSLADVLDDLARHCPDDINEDNPWPCIWGVDASRTFYFNYRPNTQVMSIDTRFAMDRAEGLPMVMLSGSTDEAVVGGWRETDGADIRNQLVINGGADVDGEQIRLMFQNAASFQRYRRWRRDVQDLPEVRDADSAARFAAGYFQRYAFSKTSWELSKVAIPSAQALPFPWSGYCQALSDSLEEGDDGKRSIQSVRVEWGVTPLASILVGETEQSAFAGACGSPRWPGSAFKAAYDRIPKAARGAGSSSVTNNTSLDKTFWHYAIGFGGTF